MNVIEEHWQEILQRVKEDCELLDVSYNMWLKPLQVYKYENGTLYILVSLEEIAINIINKKYSFPIKSAVAEITGISCEIQFIQQKDVAAMEEDSSYNNTPSVFEANLNKEYTFDTFVVGSNNQFAYAASLAVAESPGTIYNPLFLYSGVGLGKTHLMHSIAHFIMKTNPSMRVLYVTSETFTNEVIEAIRNGNNNSMRDFREKYRNIDVLLIDDVQFIIGKESTQEEFFHTFNTLYGEKKQIIISSDKPPKDMDILEDRIRSRFEWGLICDISSPNYETRMAILRKKQEMEGYTVGNDVIEYIASNIKSNIRELEGALTKIKAYSNLVKQDVNLELAEQVLKDIISPNEKKVVTPEIIINMVAEQFEITPADIIGNKRSSKIVYPRQIAMYLCRTMLDIPLTQVGSYIGNRDHTTVIHGINKIQDDLKTSEQTQKVIATLKKKLNS